MRTEEVGGTPAGGRSVDVERMTLTRMDRLLVDWAGEARRKTTGDWRGTLISFIRERLRVSGDLERILRNTVEEMEDWTAV